LKVISCEELSLYIVLKIPGFVLKLFCLSISEGCDSG